MSTTMDATTNATIGFEHLAVKCIIGVLPHEREYPQMLFIDLAVDYDISAAARDDDLAHAVNYAEMAEKVSAIAQQGQYQLLETLAVTCIKQLFDQYPAITDITIAIKKPAAIPDAEHTFIELSQHRS